MATTVGAEASATSTQWILDRFRFKASKEKNHSFGTGQGFGPFTVERFNLRTEILTSATPFRSYHISGCKGAGKTTLLKLIGLDLLAQGKSVYFFKNSNDIDLVRFDIERVIDSKEEAYFLIDETQANVGSTVFTLLLKNDVNHRITTIGAGVPAFESLSSAFTRKITTNRLFLTEPELAAEGVTAFFVGDTFDPGIRSQIVLLLVNILTYVGGHVYPLMRLAELLVQPVKQGTQTANQAITLLNSKKFRTTADFKDLSSRITPSFDDVDIREIFYPKKHKLSPAVLELKRRGFCDENGKIVSMLLVDLYLSETGTEGSDAPITTLRAGVSGVQDLLCNKCILL